MNNLFLLFTVCFLWLFHSIYPQQKPNILIIVADDFGFGDVGFHGNDNQTPRFSDRENKSGPVIPNWTPLK